VSARAGGRGTVGLVAGVPFATRPVGDGSVAVVQVDGVPGVPVKRSNQVVAYTDERGLAFVAGLVPWHKNQIEIDPADLPMDVDLSETVKEVVPYARSGAVVRFEARKSRQALVVLQQPGGTPVPIGAQVRLLPKGPEFLAGRRGEVWLTDLTDGAQRLRVTWPGGGCELDLALPAGETPDRIGPLVCGKGAR
jgi:outer membrane usher protein